MSQTTKFWLSTAIIAIVCYFDFYLFGEGYGVRERSGMMRQAGHLAVLLSVLAAGHWCWKTHPMQWLKQLWLYAYIAGITFIILIGAIKKTGILSNDFLDWVTTVRMFFTTPLPHLLLFMLSLIAKQQKEQA